MLILISTWLAPTFSNVSVGMISILEAMLLGAVCCAGIMLTIAARETLIKGLHAALCAITLLLLSLNVPLAMYLLAIVFAVYFIYSLSFSSPWPARLIAICTCIYAVLLSGYLLSQWPIMLSATALLPIYFGLMYAINDDYNIELSHEDEHEQGKLGNDLGLPDRASLRQAYENQRKLDPGAAMLVVIFLEGVEQINRQLGREFGDTLLSESANRIKQQLHSNDIFPIPHGNSVSRLAHLGGLHFAFVCRLVRYEHLHEQLIDDILQSTLQPFYVGNCTLEISARASYVHCDEELGQFDSLISCAYLALDKMPGHAICAYQQNMQISQVDQQMRLRELADIVINEAFEIYFQPAFTHPSGDIAYLELLLRWPHPKLGLLSAEQFIDDIRLAGLATPVAHFVIERAAEIAMALKMEDIQVPLSVNIFGPEMFKDGFLDFMEHVLLEHYLQAGEIHLEYPSYLHEHLDNKSQSRIEELRQLGVDVGIDRFGEHPITLSTLANLHVDYLKLSPILTQPPKPQGIEKVLSDLIAMQRLRGIKVICKGVESEQQLVLAQKLNCDAIQGHHLASPMNTKNMMSWLHKWHLQRND
ncbi:EAL domain-containing protein [Pseudoalteromonas sp. MMG022]|uniref:EAL domain-containing protein n=1 Tax=Pseudoalteromonas sp. MMG022 TaxID=2909978 RepID=UPI0031BA38DB|nr:GGDEF domain-containing phosphodiesterase [Pseudoalteromonas sp. MMG022]